MAEADEIQTKWTGHDLLDVNGRKIGKVKDVRSGDATAGLKWLVVKTGLFGTKKILVPAGEVRAVDEALVVSYTKDRVKDSPSINESETVTADQERNICAYYGLDYVSGFDSPVEGCADAASEASVLSPEPPEPAG